MLQQTWKTWTIYNMWTIKKINQENQHVYVKLYNLIGLFLPHFMRKFNGICIKLKLMMSIFTYLNSFLICVRIFGFLLGFWCPCFAEIFVFLLVIQNADISVRLLIIRLEISHNEWYVSHCFPNITMALVRLKMAWFICV